MIRQNYPEEYSGNGFVGAGMTTSEQAQSNNKKPAESASVETKGGNENVLAAWFIVAGLLVGITLLAERFSVGQTYAQVKLGFYNMVVITIYVVLGLALGKVFFAKVRVPLLSTLFTSI